MQHCLEDTKLYECSTSCSKNCPRPPKSTHFWTQFWRHQAIRMWFGWISIFFEKSWFWALFRSWTRDDSLNEPFIFTISTDPNDFRMKKHHFPLLLRITSCSWSKPFRSWKSLLFSKYFKSIDFSWHLKFFVIFVRSPSRIFRKIMILNNVSTMNTRRFVKRAVHSYDFDRSGRFSDEESWVIHSCCELPRVRSSFEFAMVKTSQNHDFRHLLCINAI